VPAAYDGTKDVPLVFNIHGFGSNAVQQMAYGDFKPLADRDDFIIVAPDGQGGAGGRHFNLTGESGLQDDIAMIGALLDHLEASLCIDAKRVYSTGMSDGGATTSVVACRLADRFAAFAPVAVIVYVDGCGGDHSVSIAGFMGTADPIVPFNGGQVSCCGHPTLGGAPDAMAGWAKHNGCAGTFKDDVLGTEVTKRTWSGCTGTSEVVFYMITGGGHTWPGAAVPLPALGLTTQQIKASDVIWDFFKAHPLAS
jgi:polyhydroxybutyrate depolymerase